MAYFPPTGSVVAFQSDPTKLVGTVSVASIPNTSVAVMSVVPHSVAALQGTNPWVIGNSSVQVVGTIPVSSVFVYQTIFSSLYAQIVGDSDNGNPDVSNRPVGVGGKYLAVPSAYADGNRATILMDVNGRQVVNLANTSVITVWKDSSVLARLTDTNASIIGINKVTRNDAVASFLGGNLTTRYQASDSAGRILAKPFASDEARQFGVSSVTSTSITSLIPTAGAGLRIYLTDLSVVNSGSVATIVTLTDGDSSIIARAIAPAGGGYNFQGMATPISTGGVNQGVSYQAGTATSILYITGWGYKAP